MAFDASNVEVRVRLLAGVLVDASMVKGTSRGSAKSEFLVRFQVEALLRPAMLDGPGTALVRRDKWVRVPPLALVER